MSSDFPPGVSINIIPGNTPEEMAWERLWDQLDELLIRLNLPVLTFLAAVECINTGLDAMGNDVPAHTSHGQDAGLRYKCTACCDTGWVVDPSVQHVETEDDLLKPCGLCNARPKEGE
jgi:hypothetical protein